jgi:pimeloyl-ACP methyl ester carboxylesterase
MAPSQHLGFRATSNTGPRRVDSLTELPRTMFEVSNLALSWQLLVHQAPIGDKHPVMVLPGFGGDDNSTLPLRRFLIQLGYKALPWLQGLNTGNPKKLEGAMRRFYRMQHSMGTKISLVGQSLGGVFARRIAHQFPEAVRCVVTLGSPFAATESGTTNPAVEKLFKKLSGLTVEELRAQAPDSSTQEPLPMPSTAVFSKEDGVVAWQTCIEAENEISENIRILGSHSGMAMNPNVLRIVADRLAQDPNNWQPFDTRSGCRSLLYPSY